VTLDACNLETYGSDLSLVINCLGHRFHGLPEHLQTYARIAPQTDHLLQTPFQFISHPTISSYIVLSYGQKCKTNRRKKCGHYWIM